MTNLDDLVSHIHSPDGGLRLTMIRGHASISGIYGDSINWAVFR